MVVMGVPDDGESLEGETSDEGKLQKIWSKIGETVSVDSYRRLGRNETGGRKRPILVTLSSRAAIDKVLDKTKRLKEAGAPYERIFVKKDVHSSVRNEWKRLRDVEAAEKGRPENVGCARASYSRKKSVSR